MTRRSRARNSRSNRSDGFFSYILSFARPAPRRRYGEPSRPPRDPRTAPARPAPPKAAPLVNRELEDA